MNDKIGLICLSFLITIILIGCKQKSKITSENSIDNNIFSEKTSVKKDQVLLNEVILTFFD
jgi:hypothetical protein